MSVTRLALLLVLAVALYLDLSRANETAPVVYTIGEVGMGGNGCPPHSVEAVPSPDSTSISVIFSSFEAVTNDNATRVRSACSVAFPVHAAPGQSVGFFKVDYRGYAYVPDVPGAQASFSNEYFFAGQQGIHARRTYLPGSDTDILETTSIKFQSIIWSPCGGAAIFRVNTAVAAVRPAAATDDVQIVVDSMDSTVQGSVQVAVASRKCDPLTGEPIKER